MEKLRSLLRGLRRADLEAVFAFAHSLRDPHRVLVVGAGLAVVAVLGVLDGLSGPDVGFAVFYALAVMGVTFHAGWVAGAIVAILSSGAGLSARLLYSGDVSVAAALWNLGNEMAVFAALVVMTYQGRQLLDKFAGQSRIDLLTGALNTRGVIEAFERERSRAVRTATPLSIAFIDLDNMKAVNDELGHAEGDEMLRILASSVLAAIRETDVFGRVGGDEFALILPDTDEQAALKAIQRLRSVINRRTHSRRPYISVSVGVVTFRRDPPVAADALRAADALMYVAKRAGGNRVAGRVLAWDSAPVGEFGLVFDLADPLPSWHLGDDDPGQPPASASA
ncbi:MAG: GGDEF domain-containing protein [Acidimicrobiia bacterium]|nr:GGDEF domain-containing protein [Acidimicrobiia bacterium]